MKQFCTVYCSTCAYLATKMLNQLPPFRYRSPATKAYATVLVHSPKKTYFSNFTSSRSSTFWQHSTTSLAALIALADSPTIWTASSAHFSASSNTLAAIPHCSARTLLTSQARRHAPYRPASMPAASAHGSAMSMNPECIRCIMSMQSSCRMINTVESINSASSPNSSHWPSITVIGQ